MKRHPKEEIIYGLFDTKEQVESVLKELVARGIAVEDISLLMSEDVHDRDFKMLEKTRTKDGIAAGSVIGGTLGGIVGGLVGLGGAITGLGLVIVGPMLALAATGGLVGGLIGHGMPEDRARLLQEAVHQGQALLAVHTHEPREIECAKEVFAAFHGESMDLAI